MTTPIWRKNEWAAHAPLELAESLDNFEQDDNKSPTLAMAVDEG